MTTSLPTAAPACNDGGSQAPAASAVTASQPARPWDEPDRRFPNPAGNAKLYALALAAVDDFELALFDLRHLLADFPRYRAAHDARPAGCTGGVLDFDALAFDLDGLEDLLAFFEETVVGCTPARPRLAPPAAARPKPFDQARAYLFARLEAVATRHEAFVAAVTAATLATRGERDCLELLAQCLHVTSWGMRQAIGSNLGEVDQRTLDAARGAEAGRPDGVRPAA